MVKLNISLTTASKTAIVNSDIPVNFIIETLESRNGFFVEMEDKIEVIRYKFIPQKDRYLIVRLTPDSRIIKSVRYIKNLQRYLVRLRRRAELVKPFNSKLGSMTYSTS